MLTSCTAAITYGDGEDDIIATVQRSAEQYCWVTARIRAEKGNEPNSYNATILNNLLFFPRQFKANAIFNPLTREWRPVPAGMNDVYYFHKLRCFPIDDDVILPDAHFAHAFYARR